MAKAHLLQQLREEIRLRHLNVKTENAYISWIKRFILFHDRKHPRDLGRNEIRAFISHITQEKKAPPDSHNQALAALVFLYKHVVPFRHIQTEPVHETKPPTVFSHEEAMAVLEKLHGAFWLIAYLMYGSGLRVQECLSLRVKDLNFDTRQIKVRGHGSCKERVAVFPSILSEPLHLQLYAVKTWFDRDMKAGRYKNDPRCANDPYWEEQYEWQDQYVFPSFTPVSEEIDSFILRSHIDAQRLQRIVKQAIQDAGISRNASIHTFRHSFACEMLKRGNDMRFLQRILGHNRISTTMIYSRVESI
ncbi:MAG: integron integrase [Gammaproteobacteria bacterium]|nr:integron integrase [Gammaproteobacteria bacterium]MDH5800877.1 integron integrase [Gammaproteobacteria bacterium]